MQSQLDSELKYTDDDIRQLREAVNHLVQLNEELNAKMIAMNAYVINGDRKNKAAVTYIRQLEWAIQNYTKGNE